MSLEPSDRSLGLAWPSWPDSAALTLAARFMVTCHLLITTATLAGATSDTEAPTVSSFTINPTTIDTSLGPQTIDASIRVMDDLSGFTIFGWHNTSTASAVATFQGPAGGIARVSFTPGQRVSGDHLDGVYASQVTLPRYSHAGTWSLRELVVTDIVGNYRVLGLPQLEVLGSPTRFTVAGLEDRTPPELVSLSVEPVEVDPETGIPFASITARMKDTISGLDSDPAFPTLVHASLMFVSPSRRQTASAIFLTGARITGDKFDGVYSSIVVLPPYAENGIWLLHSVFITDAAGNQKSISTADLIDLGLPYQFAFENPGEGPEDSNPPQLASFVLATTQIDTSETGGVIAVTARLTDDVSGFYIPGASYSGAARALATFVSPSRLQSARVSFGFGGLNQVSGTPTDFTCTSFMTLPPYSRTGVWTLESVNLTDVAGNSMAYLSSDLRQLGLPTEFAVGIAPSIKITRQAEHLLLSWPSWASAFSLRASDHLGSPGAWAPTGPNPIVFEGTAIVTMPASEGNQFFRLEEAP